MKREFCPSGPPGINRHNRARFFRRLALIAAVFLLLTLLSVVATAWSIAGRLGMAGWSLAIPVLLIVIAGGFTVTAMGGGMRAFAFSLRSVMDAADRVAEGDYTVRVREYGPPPMRALARSFNTMTERLQNADRVRRDLMADVAHELRTPLTVLQGRLEGQLDGVYPRDDGQISEALEETRVLSRLIEDLRTLALADAGALPLQKEPTDVADLVEDAVRSLEAEAARKGVALSVAPPARPSTAVLDPFRIREVITNLLSNAVRHTGPGGTVSVSVTESDAGTHVAVADTGTGMDAADVGRMFDRFYKGSESRGSGLGLAIAKGIVTSHGGDISAASEIGRGTTVRFTLPRITSA
jgi:signal transduction histidine kinase